MKRYFYKYIVEFFVIVTGVLISFYVEKNKAADYRDELKNHSLNRLTINIQEDISDSKINYRIHSRASNACEKLINDYDRLYHSRKDSRIFEFNIKDYFSSKISKIKKIIKSF